MDRIVKITFYCVCLILFVGCTTKKINDKYSLTLGALAWIEGEWKCRGNGGTMFEKWELTDKKRMVGNSYSLRRGDTVFSETIRIEESTDGIFYIVKVDHNEHEVAFKFVDNTPKGVVFENWEHDFPNRIVYAHTKGDMLLARIEGVRDGQPDTVRFFMNRVDRFAFK